MRKQIAAANWKMNLTYSEGENLLKALNSADFDLKSNQQVIIAVPFPYLDLARKLINRPGVFVAAENCYDKVSGAYTGEVSVEMLKSMAIAYVILGHSERREYFSEDNAFLSRKVNLVLEYGLNPVFCCGEALDIRESGEQNLFVGKQLEESLFHLSADDIQKVVIAYEPIWAIGTGKTASSAQAQDMHAFIRSHIAAKYGDAVAQNISILYGGSVKASNSPELFSQTDVDGGLVGGASLKADEFNAIIKALN